MKTEIKTKEKEKKIICDHKKIKQSCTRMRKNKMRRNFDLEKRRDKVVAGKHCYERDANR